MTPQGYFRHVEKFARYIRDNQDTETGLDQPTMDKMCAAIDQAWAELDHDDRLIVYNVTKFIGGNIQPAQKVEPEKPLIQLLN